MSKDINKSQQICIFLSNVYRYKQNIKESLL